MSGYEKVPISEPEFLRWEGGEHRSLQMRPQLRVPDEGPDRGKWRRRSDVEECCSGPIHSEDPRIGRQGDDPLSNRINESLKLDALSFNFFETLSGLGMKLSENTFKLSQLRHSVVGWSEALLTLAPRPMGE
jgi:hypothetical protein